KRKRISNVTKEIRKFLVSQDYIEDDEINNECDKELEDIVFFLAINTVYKEPLDLDEYSHLMNIVPQLSKCLLINVVCDLNLCEYFSTVVEKLPIWCSIELLEEALPYLKKSIPKMQLHYSFILLKAASNKLVSIGCSREIEEDDEPLQQTISEKAYAVVEEYRKYEDAKELLTMLDGMAKKPKTLSERIHEADVPTIIKHVNKGNRDQKKWFQALLITQVFNNKDAMKCIDKWAHLCDEDDVLRLLNLCSQSHDSEATKLIVKCASELRVHNLMVVIMRYYSQNKFSHVLTEDIRPQLTLLFNQMTEAAELGNSCIRNLLLLLLQNPVDVLRFTYGKCLISPFYTSELREAFLKLRDFSKIDNIGMKTLDYIIVKVKPKAENIDNYVVLLTTMLETRYIIPNMMTTVLFTFLKGYRRNKVCEHLNCALQIVRGVSVGMFVSEETRNFIELLLDIMNENRSSMVKFNHACHQNAKYTVDIIAKLYKTDSESNFQVQPRTTDDGFTTYYTKVLSSKGNVSMLEHFCPNFSMDNYARCVGHLLKILPRLVTPEWLKITEELCNAYGCEQTTELLVDAVILVCQTAQTQGPNDDILMGVTYCIQQFGLIIQQRIQVNSSLDVEISVTKHTCRLLRYIPDAIKEAEGLSLINILTDGSLQSLAKDKAFLYMTLLIKNETLCTALSRKMFV
ncbi:hypothetical protein NQ318_012757, partial [Aromia moschata]